MISISRNISAVLCILCVFVSPANAGETGANAGFRIIFIEDPVSQKPMKAAIFFPTQDRAGVTRNGPLEIPAKMDAAVEMGRHPLILLSHGNGGSMFSHHDTATFLAKRGYLVAAIEHPGDNFRDGSGLGTDRVLAGRSVQLIALLDHLLSRAGFSEAIDPHQVGVAGFSAGGYTALLTVGATPDFSRLKLYCARHPDSVLCSGRGDVRISSPPVVPKSDARIRAAFAMSPVAALLDPASLSTISVPVEIYAAGNDSVLPVQDNARWVRDRLPAPVEYAEIAGADHFVFLTPCTPPMESAVPDLCLDRPGVDRHAIHETLNGDMFRFFQRRFMPAARKSSL